MKITIKNKIKELDFHGYEYTSWGTAVIEGQEDMDLQYHAYENNLESEDPRFDDMYSELVDIFEEAEVSETINREDYFYVQYAVEQMEMYTELDAGVRSNITIEVLNEVLSEDGVDFVIPQEEFDHYFEVNKNYFQ